ncbi:MAG: HAD family phosphatase [Alphaproteobacteria bacterium]|nr:HAD family phosphatase [Alphaproteobacteria bacterium]
MSFDLIIWDCDGCLVDSEVIACAIPAALATASGYPITTEEYIERFAGKSAGNGASDLVGEAGYEQLDAAFHEKVYQETLRGFTDHLKPIEGLAAVLSGLHNPMCVASGSSVERNRHALTIVGLLPFFDGRIFCSSQVAQGKPAPDVFLFAAQQMGVAPAQCLVIEDSVPGVQAAKAAGMTVFAYLGGSHVSESWRERIKAEKPDSIFDDMPALPSLIEGYKKTS